MRNRPRPNLPDPGRERRPALSVVKSQPAVVRGAIVAVVTAVVHVLVVAGVVDHDTEKSLAPLIDALGFALAIVWIRYGVTPNAKVVARVSTSEGVVVAGDAATVTTGATIPARGVTVTGEPVLAPIPVDPSLVPDIPVGG